MAGSVLVHNGRAGTFVVGPAVAGLSFGRAEDVAASPDMLGSVQHGGDALVRLNDAFAPDPVFVDVPAGVAGGRAGAARPLVRPGRGRLPPSQRARR